MPQFQFPQTCARLVHTVAKGWCWTVSFVMDMRLVSIAIFVVFLSGLPARAQTFNRQDLDCAVAATIEDARANKGATEENHELLVFFIRRLTAQDDETNWARVAYDRSQVNRKQYTAELLAKCVEIYQSSFHR